MPRPGREAGDDEPGIDALRPGLDPGDDALDPAPAAGGVEELGEAPDLGVAGPARGGAGLQAGHPGAQRRIGVEAEDEVDAGRAAEVDDFGRGIVAVAADQDLDARPTAPQRPDQPAQVAGDLAPARPSGGAQDGGDDAAVAVEHEDRLEPVAVEVRVEQPQLLAAMGGIECVVEVEHDPLGYLAEAVAIEVHHRPRPAQQRANVRPVLQPGDRRLGTRGRPPTAAGRAPSLKAGSPPRLSASIASS